MNFKPAGLAVDIAGSTAAITMGSEGFKSFLAGSAQATLWASVRPDVLLGWVPLFGVQELDITRSQQDLKYRAVGSAFLAQQEGGNVAVRIDGILPGPLRHLFLSLLDALFLWTSGEEKNNDVETDDGIIQDVTPQSLVLKWSPFMELAQRQYNNPVFGTQIHHKTFTFLSKFFIFFDMYIETFRMQEAVRHGKNVYQYTIMLRRYNKPIRYVSDKATKEEFERKKTYYKDRLNQSRAAVGEEGKEERLEWIDNHLPGPDPTKAGTNLEAVPVKAIVPESGEGRELLANLTWRSKEIIVQVVYDRGYDLADDIGEFLTRKARYASNGITLSLYKSVLAILPSSFNSLNEFAPTSTRTVKNYTHLAYDLSQNFRVWRATQAKIYTYEIPPKQEARLHGGVRVRFNDFKQMIVNDRPAPRQYYVDENTFINYDSWNDSVARVEVVERVS